MFRHAAVVIPDNRPQQSKSQGCCKRIAEQPSSFFCGPSSCDFPHIQIQVLHHCVTGLLFNIIRIYRANTFTIHRITDLLAPFLAAQCRRWWKDHFPRRVKFHRWKTWLNHVESLMTRSVTEHSSTAMAMRCFTNVTNLTTCYPLVN